MFLLPHKSWNVWNSKNIEKVQQDEEKHRKKEEENEKRKMGIEQEKRYTELKDRIKRRKIEEENFRDTKQEDESGSHEIDESQADSVVEKSNANIEQSKHINFFEELERYEEEQKSLSAIAAAGSKLMSTTKGGPHPEAEAEKKKQEERFTPYLGGSAEMRNAKAWYENGAPAKKDEKKEKRVERQKDRLDPLHEMNKYLTETKKHADKKEKKEKEKNTKKTIDDLRKERMEREKIERERVQAILYGPKQPAAEAKGNNQRTAGGDQGYSNRYNPQYTRR